MYFSQEMYIDDVEIIEDINKILANIESYVWENNCNILPSLIPPPPSSKTTKE
jgi:hypothetical protein